MIRKAGECDISQIAACEACCFPLPLSARAIADMLKNPLYLFLVAEDQGTFAGHAAILFTGETAEILSVAVLPAFREKGLAPKRFSMGYLRVDHFWKKQKSKHSGTTLLKCFWKSGFPTFRRSVCMKNTDLKKSPCGKIFIPPRPKTALP